MSAKMMGRVWELVLTPAKQIVLLALADHADHEGNNVKPGVPLIAWKTGYSERQVQRILRELIHDGLLVEVEQRLGKPYVYSLDLAKGLAKSPYAPRLRQPAKGDKMSPPGGDTDVTPDKMSPVTSHESDDSLRGDIPSANLSRIRQEEEPSLKEINAPDGAPTSSIPEANNDPENPILWLPGNHPTFTEARSVELYPCTPADVSGLIAAWWEWVPKRPTKRGKVIASKTHFANLENRTYAENMIQRGISAGDFIEFLSSLRYDEQFAWKHLRDRELTFCYVAPAIEEWVQQDREENWDTAEMPRVLPRRPGLTFDLGAIEDGDNLLERYKDNHDFIVEIRRPYISPQQAAGEDDALPESAWSADDETLLSEIGIPL